MAKWVQGTNEQGQPDWAWETDDGQYLDRDPDGNMSPEIDTSAELGVVDRLRYALAPDNPEAQLEAIKRLGKQGVIENGKVYVVEGGRRYEPDSPDLTWKDAADVAALVPEAIGSTFGGIGGGLIGAATTGGAGAVPGSMAGAGIGGGAGTYVRHKAAQLAGVVDPDAPVPIGDIATSMALNAVAGPIAGKVAQGVKWAAGIPARVMASGTGDAILEQTFSVPAKSVRQAFGTGGRELAERVARGDTMLETAARLVGAPQKVVKDAGKQYAALRDQVISKDVWADPDPIIKVFNDGLKTVTEKGPNGETKIVGVLKADMDAFNETRKLVQRMATNAKSGTTKGYGGMSAEYLYGLRKQADGLLKARGVYRKMEHGDDIGPVDKLLLDIRNAMEDEVENTAERYYGTTAGPEAKQAYIAAKEQYRMALELANQLGASFGIRSKKIGDKVVFNLADAGRVAQTLRNITNTPKEAQSILLKDLGRIAPEYRGDVEDVFKFAEAKPWMQSDVSQTGKSLKPLAMASMGAGVSQAAIPVPVIGAIPGVAGGLYAAGKLAPQSAIEWLPAIGEATRQASKKLQAPARAMAPIAEPLAPIGRAVARQATVETIRRNTGPKSAQASELREIGKLAPATDAPASLVRDVIESQKAPALEYVNTHYRQLLDKYRASGMADDDAAMAVVRDIGGRKKNGGRVAPFIDNIKRELRTAGYDVKEPDVIQFMNAIQE